MLETRSSVDLPRDGMGMGMGVGMGIGMMTSQHGWCLLEMRPQRRTWRWGWDFRCGGVPAWWGLVSLMRHLLQECGKRPKPNWGARVRAQGNRKKQVRPNLSAIWYLSGAPN